MCIHIYAYEGICVECDRKTTQHWFYDSQMENII